MSSDPTTPQTIIAEGREFVISSTADLTDPSLEAPYVVTCRNSRPKDRRFRLLKNRVDPTAAFTIPEDQPFSYRGPTFWFRILPDGQLKYLKSER